MRDISDLYSCFMFAVGRFNGVDIQCRGGGTGWGGKWRARMIIDRNLVPSAYGDPVLGGTMVEVMRSLVYKTREVDIMFADEKSPQHGGNIPKKERTPMSMLKVWTPEAAPESQYPPATEQPEEELVGTPCACDVLAENLRLKDRVKALEEALRELMSIVNIHSKATDSDFAWAEMCFARKALEATK